MDTHAKPIDSGVLQKIQAELLVPDPDKTTAMEIINEPQKHNCGTDGDNRQGCCKNCP